MEPVQKGDPFVVVEITFFDLSEFEKEFFLKCIHFFVTYNCIVKNTFAYDRNFITKEQKYNLLRSPSVHKKFFDDFKTLRTSQKFGFI